MLGKHFEVKNFATLQKTAMTCAQIFTHGPKSTQMCNFDHDIVKQATRRLPIYAHATYLSHPWKRTKMHFHIKEQLEVCKKLKLSGLVIHLPKDIPEIVVKTMEIINDPDMLIILEMTSVAPDPKKTYETPEKLNALIEALLESQVDINFGICIDTSHVWAAGQDMSRYDNVQDWINRIKYPDYIKLFHINGTTIELGGHKDVHEPPFSSKDLIWNNIPPKDSGMRAIVEFAGEYNIPLIMELTKSSNKAIEDAYNIVDKLIKDYT